MPSVPLYTERSQGPEMFRDLLESSEIELWSGQAECWWAGPKSCSEYLGNPMPLLRFACGSERWGQPQ